MSRFLTLPSRDDIHVAPELAPLAVLDAALAVAEQVLCVEHTLDVSDVPDTEDPTTLVVAKLVAGRIIELRGLLACYRGAVDRAIPESDRKDYPF